jgi:putative acetyltransferase
VRGIAVADYPLEAIEAWAPLPITDQYVERVRANRDGEIRLAAVAGSEIVGIGALLLDRRELRACYVAPPAARKGVGAMIVREIERTARENRLDTLWLDSSLTAEPFYLRLGYVAVGRGLYRVGTGYPMACVKMCKDL